MSKERIPVKFYKIPLKGFIEVLQSVLDEGANYIDIIGVPNEEQDMIGIHVAPEYFDSEEDDLPLTDDRLDQLI